MYAVVRTGGKQYRVANNDIILVEKLLAAKGDTISLDDVLLMGEGANVKPGGSVKAEVLDQIRDDTIIVFKKKRRHNYRRRNGHRQHLTVLKITAIGDVKAEPKIKKVAAEPAPYVMDPSNLSLISGIGPTIEKKLLAAGIKTWDDIASWTDADIEKWTTELKLGSRVKREEWVEQAKELLAGKPPRAKIDQAEAAKETK